MVGGDASAYEKIKPIFEALGADTKMCKRLELLQDKQGYLPCARFGEMRVVPYAVGIIRMLSQAQAIGTAPSPAPAQLL